MWRTRESIPAIRFWISKHPPPTWSLKLLRAATCYTSFALWLHHAHPFVAAAERSQSHSGKQSFRSRSCGLQEVWQCTDCAPMWLPQTAFKPLWFGSGAASLSATDVRKMWRTKESIPAIRFWISKHPPPAWSLKLLRAATCYTSSALWLHHAHPFVAAAERSQSHSGKQSARSRSCGLQEVWQCTDCALSCAMRLCECCKPMNNCRDWAFSNIGLEEWLPAFQLPMFVLPKRDLSSTCLLEKSIPAIPFWISKHPLPARSRFLRAAVCSTMSALWLHHAHPFVAAAEKRPVSCREAEGLVTELWSPRFVYNALIVLLCDCRKLSF